MLMTHASADLIFNHQGGRRGEEDVFSPTMAMLMGSRKAGRGTVGFRTMISLEPATIGKSGYPLLLQTGETADGRGLNALAAQYLDLRKVSIYGGTNEVQKNLIARALLGSQP